jgi:hypothetical protein
VRPIYLHYGRTRLGVVVMVLALLAALVVLPGTALGQTVTPATPAATVASTPGAQATANPTPQAGLSLSATQGAPGMSVTAFGSGYRPGESVHVTFNATLVGATTANTGGTFGLSFDVADLAIGNYNVVATGESSGATAATTFNINQSGARFSFSIQQAVPGSAMIVTGLGFQPGDAVNLTFNDAAVGSVTADTTGGFSASIIVPDLAAGQYTVTAHGQAAGVSTTAPFTVLAATATAVPVVAPTATAAPTLAPQPVVPGVAPAMAHDDRYFGQTGYRIDNDEVWGFFGSYGGLDTFGYPVSRTITLLGCPVQMFQRQIIQVCPSQGAALINLLDPDIFPYTQVNGSTFPAPDATMKANTPPVSDPNYSANISSFVQTNVPDSVGGQPVNFLQRFNASGGLTIWGAPISNPQPDPNNANFVYQRFQRGIMHYIAGVGTESVLLADYLKAIMTNQNVPTDLLQQARESRFYNQYCPTEPMGLCRPNELGGTDLTFAFLGG